MAAGFIAPTPTTRALTVSSPIAFTSLACSSFTGTNVRSVLATKHSRVRKGVISNDPITMKKGRAQRSMPQRPQQQQPQSKVPEDGTPLFSLFVRTSRQKIWYPLGAVTGDDRSKNLVNSLKSGFSRGMSENAMDKGMAQTLYGKQNERFLQGAFRLYPQLKKFSRDLEFGYRVAAVGLEEQKTRVVTKEMALPFFASVQKTMSGWMKKVQGK